MEDGFLPDYHHSIFYHLIEYASDTDSKLILLDQILEVGDKKEIPLLEELENCSELIISNKAFYVKEQLLSNLEVTIVEDELMPMSLCFLYEEFDINPPKIDTELDIDFELSLDIFKTEFSDFEK